MVPLSTLRVLKALHREPVWSFEQLLSAEKLWMHPVSGHTGCSRVSFHTLGSEVKVNSIAVVLVRHPASGSVAGTL